MSETHETSPLPEFPWRFKAFGELASMEQEFREIFKERIETVSKDNVRYLLVQSMDIPAITPDRFSIPHVDALELGGIGFPIAENNTRYEPFIRLHLTATQEGGSFVGVNGEDLSDFDIHQIGWTAFFGAESPPFVVNDRDLDAADPTIMLPSGFVQRGTSMADVVSNVENKHLLTDRDCEILVDLAKTADKNNFWYT